MNLKGQETEKLHPKYNHFKGKIVYDEKNDRYVTSGIIKKINMSTINISELPIGISNDKYYDILDTLVDKKIIKDYTKNDTDVKVDITVNISREALKQIEDDDNMVQVFKLESFISMSNMHLFNRNGQIQKYANIDEIIKDFSEIRLEYYQKRKDYILSQLERDRKILFNKMKFINYILKDELILKNKKRAEIEERMIELGIVKMDDSFNYLLNMSLLSLSNEKLNELKEVYNQKKVEIETLTNTTIKQLWLKDLNDLYKKIK